MRIKKLFGMKKFMRTMALGLAAVLTVSGLGVMEAEAAAKDIIYPKYDTTTGKYTYNEKDVFGAATHVHLFGYNVKTTVHTHGNVMAENADLSEIGMRDGKVAYPEDYVEYSYVGDNAVLPNITVHNPIIIGSDMSYDKASGGKQGTVTNKNGSTTSAQTVYDGIYYVSGVDAVDVVGTLNQLKALSKDWAIQPGDTTATFDLTSEPNNRVIDAVQKGREDQNVYINIPISDWENTSNYIQIKGIDSNVANTGFVVINLDLAGYTNIDLSCNDMKVYDTNGATYNNTEHTSAAFGSCRIVYNLYDSSKEDYTYTGKVTFTGTVFGNILAPGADVTVGAINGNVMAYSITHDGQESHRLDIVPIFSKNDGSVATEKIEKEEIRLLLELKDQSTTPTTDGVSSETTYTLYEDEACTTPVVDSDTENSITNTTAVWNEEAGKYQIIISSEDVTEKLELEETYFLKKTAVNAEYMDNNTVFEAYIDKDGTVLYREIKEGSATNDRKHEVLTDVLTKKAPEQTPENAEIIIKAEFSGPVAGEPGDDGKKVEYQIYSDADCENPIEGKKASLTPDENGNWQVVFDKEATDDLVKGTAYYVAVAGNDSGFRNVDNKPYMVQFSESGVVQYYEYNNTTGTYEVKDELIDKLIKNEGLALDVVFEGGQPEGTDSKVTYDVYKAGGTKVTTTPIEATDSDNDDVYEVTVDSKFTTENMDRNTPYYIGITTNGSGYTDKIEEQYWVKFDDNGNAKYSTDKDAPDSKWVAGPLEDVLMKTGTTETKSNGTIVINVEFSGPVEGEPTNTDISNVKYQVYSDTDCSTKVGNVVVGVTAGTNDQYKAEFGTDLTAGLVKDTVYYIKVDNGSTFKDVSEDVYQVKFDDNGTALYYKVADQTFDANAVPTDTLIKNEGLALDVVFEGGQPEGTDSKVTYDVYKAGGTKVTTTPIEATDSDNDDVYEVTVDSKFTTENMDRNTPYYIGITTNGSGYTDKIEEQYWVKFDDNGNAKYSTDKDAPDSKWVAGPLEDVLIKTPEQTTVKPSDKIVINVEFSGPNANEPSDTDGSSVKYQIYTDAECKNPVAGKEATITKDANGNWQVVFDEEATKDLTVGTDYYITVAGNGSGFKDVEKEPYKVQFDTTDGKTKYDTEDGKSPTDKLIKNDGLKLEVEFKGETPTDETGKVTYDVYDEDGNKVTTTPVEATDGDNDGFYEVEVGSDFTTEKLDRDENYYIGISDNQSGYDDEKKDQYWVKFDEDGKVEYSTDKDTWQDEPLKDILVKEDAGTTTPPGDDSTGGNTGSNTGNNTGGNTSTGSNTSAGSTATGGANATGGATVTGSVTATSPKTGEGNMIFVLAGLAVLSALAGSMYAYRRRA